MGAKEADRDKVVKRSKIIESFVNGDGDYSEKKNILTPGVSTAALTGPIEHTLKQSVSTRVYSTYVKKSSESKPVDDQQGNSLPIPQSSSRQTPAESVADSDSVKFITSSRLPN